MTGLGLVGGGGTGWRVKDWLIGIWEMSLVSGGGGGGNVGVWVGCRTWGDWLA